MNEAKDSELTMLGLRPDGLSHWAFERIEKLEAQLARARVLFAVECIGPGGKTIVETLDDELKAENKRLRELLGYVLLLWSGSMNAPLPYLTDWIRKAQEELK
jgi:hypothetical protein